MVSLQRVVVLDRATGICLFERLWSSASSVTNTAGFCNLVLTFFMMSRELNEGGVSFVLFDKPERKARPGQIRLGLARNDHVIVAALHEPTEKETAVQRVLEMLLSEFNTKFGDRFKEIKGNLPELASEKAESSKITQEEVLKTFADLGAILQNPSLVAHRSPAQGSHTL